MKKWMALALIALLVFLASGCGVNVNGNADEDKITIRIATDERADSMAYRQIEEFATLVQENSAERISVRIYKKNEWSKEKFFLDYLKAGSVTMVCLSATEVGNVQPAYQIYQQAYLFGSEKEIEQYIRSAEKNHVFQNFSSGLKPIGLVPNGYTYYCEGEEAGWKSYSELRQLQAQRALGNTTVYDLKAHYLLSVLTTTDNWWNELTDSDRELIQTAYTESLTNVFQNNSAEKDRATLGDSGVVVVSTGKADIEAAELASREQYFSAHRDWLTEFWRPDAEPESKEEEPDYA